MGKSKEYGGRIKEEINRELNYNEKTDQETKNVAKEPKDYKPTTSISEIKKEPNHIVIKPKVKNKNVNKTRREGRSSENVEKELERLRSEIKNMKGNVSGIFLKNESEISRELEEQKRKKKYDQMEYLKRNIENEI